MKARKGPAEPCTVSEVYPELLKALMELFRWALRGDVDSRCWFGTFYRWFAEDLRHWEAKKRVEHHLGAFGGMGSLNDFVDPGDEFPDGKDGVERFYRAYTILKELSCQSACNWHRHMEKAPRGSGKEVIVHASGVPVVIAHCSNGHRWVKDDMDGSYYHFHARTITKLREGLALVRKMGGKKAARWFMKNSFEPDHSAIHGEMKRVVAASYPGKMVADCKPCRKKKIETGMFYMLGDPLRLSKEPFLHELRR